MDLEMQTKFIDLSDTLLQIDRSLVHFTQRIIYLKRSTTGVQIEVCRWMQLYSVFPCRKMTLGPLQLPVRGGAEGHSSIRATWNEKICEKKK
jgi:hypothetical protein